MRPGRLAMGLWMGCAACSVHPPGEVRERREDTPRSFDASAESSTGDAAGPLTCLDRLTTARAELLREGFAPANDTPSWLQVSATADDGLLLQVYTEYTPDGDGLRTYDAEIHPSRGASRPWRLDARNLLDEFREERLPERTWTRRRNGWTAIVHTRSDEPKWVTSFERVTRPALDACLAHGR